MPKSRDTPYTPPTGGQSESHTMAKPTPSAVAGTRTPWTAADYGLPHHIKKGGAAKLASSGIAPLVAQARGYEIISDRDDAKHFSSMQRSNDSRLRTERSLDKMLNRGLDDILTMPWVQLTTVLEDGIDSRALDHQYRPSTPGVDANGKLKKYEWLPGAQMVLDVHPSTPTEWLAKAPTVILVEGLIKADSALSAQLENFVGADKLGLAGSEREARVRLHALMQQMPRQLQFLIVATASVTTWNTPLARASWEALDLHDRRTVVLFDGDLTTNEVVWKETEKAKVELRRRSKRTALLAELWCTDVEAAKLAHGFAPSAKVGVDDYLAHIGDWQSLEDLFITDLPPSPKAEKHYEPGDWRRSPENPAIIEEYTQTITPDGANRRWAPRAFVSFRTSEMRTVRKPLSEEVRTGVPVDDTTIPAEQQTVLRFYLTREGADTDDESFHADVVMPATALAGTQKSDWIRGGDTVTPIPNVVLAHPSFPPRDFAAWVKACKGDSEPAYTHGWSRYGWVPTGAGGGFAIGTTVIARTLEEERAVYSSVTEAELTGKDRWGVQDTYREGSHDQWRQDFTDDLEAGVNLWLEAFKDPQWAAVTLAFMLRPTTPFRGNGAGSVLSLAGKTQWGKSTTAALILSGWQSRKLAWHGESLPGTAKDTVPITEQRLAQTPLHVMDDLAADVSKSAQETMTSRVDDMIRSVFNGTPRQHAGAKQVPAPYAHLISTAEMPTTNPSIRSRMSELHFTQMPLKDEMFPRLQAAADDGLFARITAHAIRVWTNEIPSWDKAFEEAERTYIVAKKAVDDAIVAKKGQDMLSSLSREAKKVTALYATILGVSWGYRRVTEALGPDATPNRAEFLDKLKTGMLDLLVEHSIGAAEHQLQVSPGREALRAVKMLLNTGRAHLRNPVRPGDHPWAVDQKGNGRDARRVASGWQRRGNEWISQGPCIGVVGDVNGIPLIILDPNAAFAEVKRYYEGVVLAGATAKTTWESLQGDSSVVLDGKVTLTSRDGGRKRLAVDAPDALAAPVKAENGAALPVIESADEGAEAATKDARYTGLAVLWEGLMSLNG